MAVVKTCEVLREKILRQGASMLGGSEEEAEFDGKRVWTADGREVSLSEIGYASFEGHNRYLSASESPFVAGIAAALYGGCRGDRPRSRNR